MGRRSPLMLAIQKLVKNGTAVQVTIPVAVLRQNRWRAGNWVAIELNEDGSILVRVPRTEDFYAGGILPTREDGRTDVMP
jgi:antitoxin component of MazEF toxin-antitoxin module